MSGRSEADETAGLRASADHITWYMGALGWTGAPVKTRTYQQRSRRADWVLPGRSHLGLQAEPHVDPLCKNAADGCQYSARFDEAELVPKMAANKASAAGKRCFERQRRGLAG